MKLFRFVYGEHVEHGTPGFRPADMEFFDYMPGMGVAHDCLEHIGKEDGSLESELIAFGASLYTRYEGGHYWRRGLHTTDWGKHVSYELAEFLVNYLKGYRDDWVRPHMPSLGRGLEQDHEDQITMAIREMRKLVNEGEFDLDDDEIRRFADLTSGVFERRLRWLFRRGYRKAAKTYRSPEDAEHMFSQIEKRVDALLKHEPEAGAVLEIRVDRQRSSVDIRLNEPAYDYD